MQLIRKTQLKKQSEEDSEKLSMCITSLQHILVVKLIVYIIRLSLEEIKFLPEEAISATVAFVSGTSKGVLGKHTLAAAVDVKIHYCYWWTWFPK